MQLAEVLRYAGPWGQCFVEPLFDDEFEILDWRIVAEKHLKLKLRHSVTGDEVDAIAFNQSSDFLQTAATRYRMVYRMDVNEFRGQRTLQLIIQYIESELI